VPLDREVLEAVREMDEHDLRRLLILAKARLEAKGASFGAAAPRVRLQARLVRCGKANCTRCPHGPYWYAYWMEGGRRRSRYVGKLADAGPAPRAPAAVGKRAEETGGPT
jgi:hypothetical protein